MAKGTTVDEPELTALRKLLLGDPCAPMSSGIVCSNYWAEQLIAAIKAGKMPRKKEFRALYRAAHRAGIYPPGGNGTRMRPCLECGRDCPPAPTPLESVLCVDCQVDTSAEAKPPPEEWRAPVTWHDFLLRLSVFVRARDADGNIVLLPKELAGEALREYQLRERAKRSTLRKEITRFRRGTWRPSRTP